MKFLKQGSRFVVKKRFIVQCLILIGAGAGAGAAASEKILGAGQKRTGCATLI